MLAVNTPLAYRSGSVGRFLPGIAWDLDPVPGLTEGGRLCVRGPNVLLGYLHPGANGQLTPPLTARGAGWYDTGDLVRIDQDGFVWVLGAFVLLAQIVTLSAQDMEPAFVTHIVIDGTINPAVAEFIQESIQVSHRDGARALIIQLDTPGGLLTSTRTIVKEIFGAPLPVIVYVAPSGAGAGSAGMFITLAAHVAAMAPGTNIGAAHPVAAGGREVGGVMGEKLEKFVASYGEAIAQQRGRNMEWAVKAVRESVAITEVEALKLMTELQ